MESPGVCGGSFPNSKVRATRRSTGESAKRHGELERMSKNYDARRAVRRRCLSEPMTNLLSPFEGADTDYVGRDDGGGRRVFNPRFRFSPGWNFATWKSIASLAPETLLREHSNHTTTSAVQARSSSLRVYSRCIRINRSFCTAFVY